MNEPERRVECREAHRQFAEWLAVTQLAAAPLARDYLALLADLEEARKSADFQRQRADRGWFLYEHTLTAFLDFKESLPDAAPQVSA